MSEPLRRRLDRFFGSADDVRAVVFDAMGTIFDLTALDPRFEQLGADAAVREAWFERLLDTSKALTIVGQFEPFDEIALSTLRTTLAGHGLDAGEAEELVKALAEVPAYPDAAPALTRLAEAGIPSVILTNGGAEQTKTLLARAALDDYVRHVFTATEVKAYKPDPRPYRHVCEQLGTDAAHCMLVAAHGWDVIGAKAVGYETIWVDRIEHCWPLPGDEPSRRESDLERAVSLLLGTS